MNQLDLISSEISGPHNTLGTTYALPGRHGRGVVRGRRQRHAALAGRGKAVPQLLASSRTAVAFSRMIHELY